MRVMDGGTALPVTFPPENEGIEETATARLCGPVIRSLKQA